MYCPLVRGKQFELIALRELADLLSPQYFKPIIEPVRDNYSPLLKTIECLNNRNIEPIVIINPCLGDFKTEPLIIDDILLKLNPNIKYTPCYGIKEHDNHIYESLNKKQGRKAAYVYDKIDSRIVPILNECEYSIVPIDAPTGALRKLKNIILMDDPFQKKRKNADYLNESYFSDIHTSYKNKGIDVLGFGDYTIVGSEFSESGGPAYVVTIHMSYIDEENFDAMSVKHFSSEDNGSLVDPGGKFLEALQKFVIFDHDNPNIFDDTDGKEELHKLFKNKQFSGLGIVKKIAIKHHIETLCNYISKE
ncbi:sce7725 family protein [Pantoea dispersa]|uniref:sce7725 family protein n=1 Tax=Pantoea dispersa TaxID=59814 RepID=UPI002585DFE1|nr:sce7725 family protein [Pantoea dispersa]MEB5838799.1 sce7725 family protein [Pantoea dispersa]